MTRVYMIRHGRPESGWGDQGADPDPGLDEVGRGQARAAAAHLLAAPTGERPTGVVSSPLRRCRETAAPFADAVGRPARIEPAVAEIPTPMGMATADRGGWLRRGIAGRWSEIDGDIDYSAWRDAVAAAVVEAAGGAVFSHFVAINAAVSAATGDPRVLVFQPDQGSITTFEVENGLLSLVCLGRQASTKVL